MPFSKCEFCHGDAVSSDGMFLCLSGCGHVKGTGWQSSWTVWHMPKTECFSSFALLIKHEIIF